MNRNMLMSCHCFRLLTDVVCKRSVTCSQYLKKKSIATMLECMNPDRSCCSLGVHSYPQGINTEYSRSIINLFTAVRRNDCLLNKLLNLFGIKYEGEYIY